MILMLLVLGSYIENTGWPRGYKFRCPNQGLVQSKVLGLQHLECKHFLIPLFSVIILYPQQCLVPSVQRPSVLQFPENKPKIFCQSWEGAVHSLNGEQDLRISLFLKHTSNQSHCFQSHLHLHFQRYIVLPVSKCFENSLGANQDGSHLSFCQFGIHFLKFAKSSPNYPSTSSFQNHTTINSSTSFLFVLQAFKKNFTIIFVEFGERSRGKSLCSICCPQLEVRKVFSIQQMIFPDKLHLRI